MPADYSQPPRDLPVYLKFLLGLSSDASREEIDREWAAQIIPLMNSGPQALFDREAMQLMGSGLTGPQARRVFQQSKRGAMLADSAEREADARRRSEQSKPPFLQGKA